MPPPNPAQISDPLGPLRDKRTVDISASAYEHPSGFICQAVAAGDLTYRTLEGDTDLTETVVAGQVIGVGSFPVLVTAVRANATIGSIVVGIL